MSILKRWFCHRTIKPPIRVNQHHDPVLGMGLLAKKIAIQVFDELFSDSQTPARVSDREVAPRIWTDC